MAAASGRAGKVSSWQVIIATARLTNTGVGATNYRSCPLPIPQKISYSMDQSAATCGWALTACCSGRSRCTRHPGNDPMPTIAAAPTIQRQ